MNPKQMNDALYLTDPQAKEEITVSTVAKSLTSGIYGSNTRALIQCQGANVRYWIVSGATPTTDSGHILYNGDCLELHSAGELALFSAIRGGSTDATLAVSYFKKAGA